MSVLKRPGLPVDEYQLNFALLVHRYVRHFQRTSYDVALRYFCVLRQFYPAFAEQCVTQLVSESREVRTAAAPPMHVPWRDAIEL